MRGWQTGGDEVGDRGARVVDGEARVPAQDVPQLEPADADQAGEKVRASGGAACGQRLGEGGARATRGAPGGRRGRLGERGRDVLLTQRSGSCSRPSARSGARAPAATSCGSPDAGSPRVAAICGATPLVDRPRRARPWCRPGGSGLHPDAGALGDGRERDLVPRALDEEVKRRLQDPLGVGLGGFGTATLAIRRGRRALFHGNDVTVKVYDCQGLRVQIPRRPPHEGDTHAQHRRHPAPRPRARQGLSRHRRRDRPRLEERHVDADPHHEGPQVG